MQIATYVDDAGRIANLYVPGHMRLYEEATGTWQQIRSIPFHVTTEMSLIEVKTALRSLVEQITECQTLLSTRISGLIYSLIQEEHGFRVWKCNGPPELHLDLIARQDNALAAQREREAREHAFAALFSSPSGGCSGGADFDAIRPRHDPNRALQAIRSLSQPLGEDGLRIDLGDILQRFRNANSRDVLFPLLENRHFSSLEILCEHLPRWFHEKIAALDLGAEISRSDTGMIARVYPLANRSDAHE